MRDIKKLIKFLDVEIDLASQWDDSKDMLTEIKGIVEKPDIHLNTINRLTASMADKNKHISALTELLKKADQGQPQPDELVEEIWWKIIKHQNNFHAGIMTDRKLLYEEKRIKAEIRKLLKVKP